MVKSIILMRHAEREDRAQEKQGLDWISTAPRPQDPTLSAEGMKIIPFIAASQCVQTEMHFIYSLAINHFSSSRRYPTSQECWRTNEVLGHHKNTYIADDKNCYDI